MHAHTIGHQRWALIVVLLLVPLAGYAAENTDPHNSGAQYAYAENVGWINAEPGGNGGAGLEVTDDELFGFLWGENIGWINLSCENNGTCASAAFGVLNDGCGRLSGEAWAENIGWIRFDPNPSGVFIDPQTGWFSGRAWAENVGWITFASTGAVDYGIRTSWRRQRPSGVVDLHLSHSKTTTILTWTFLPDAENHDVVGGSLGTLRRTGDFSAATDSCLANDLAANSVKHSTTPTPGRGTWFLVRANNCGGTGTFDTRYKTQHHPRDGEIAASGAACP